MSALKKAMLYLGLGPDEEYEQYSQHHPEPEGHGSDDRQVRAAPMPSASTASDPTGTVRTIRPVPTEPQQGQYSQPAQSAHLGQEPPASSAIGAVRPAVDSLPEGSVVRPLPMAVATKPYTIAPSSFNDAQEVGDRYMAKQPIIVNLQGADRDLARRIIDFASGLCYGLAGQMERVANQVYLLTPTNVEVSPEERQRLLERGFGD